MVILKSRGTDSYHTYWFSISCRSYDIYSRKMTRTTIVCSDEDPSTTDTTRDDADQMNTSPSLDYKKEPMVNENGKEVVAKSSCVHEQSFVGAQAASYLNYQSKSVASLPPGALGEAFCNVRDSKEIYVPFEIDNTSQIEMPDHSTPDTSRHPEGAVCPAQTKRSTSVPKTPERGLEGSRGTPIAKRARLGEITPIVSGLTTSTRPVSRLSFASSRLAIPKRTYKPKNIEEGINTEGMIKMTHQRQTRDPDGTVSKRNAGNAATRPPVPPRARHKLKLPTSSNRRLASRKLYLENEENVGTYSEASDEYTDDEQDEEIIQNSTNVVYSWDALQLGEKLGSAALNQFFADANEGRAPKLNSRQVLQIISSMRVKTILPPPGSLLHKVVHRTRLFQDENNTAALDNDASYASTSPRVPFDKLEKVYETMCLQDIDDGSANRREVQYMNVNSLLDKFRSFENQVCDLKMREKEIMAKANELRGGLIDRKLVYRMMGYRDACEDWNNPVQQQPNFDPVTYTHNASI